MTARVGLPARLRTSRRIMADSSSGVCSRSPIRTVNTFRPPPASRSVIWCGMSFNSCRRSARVRPMSRLTLKIVCSGSLRARSRAAVPTRTVPSGWKLMTLGTRALPDSSRTTTGRPSRT